MKKYPVFILCVCLLSCVLFGCASDDAPYVPTGDALAGNDYTAPVATDKSDASEQDLVLVYYPTEPMNPYTCNDYTNRTLFSLIYQSLFVVDRDYQVSPMLCSRYSMTEDMRGYTFYIESATFSDGSPLTINDVLASFQAAKESAYYKGRFLHVDAIALSADGGISFTLDTAYENFPLLLDIPIVKAGEVAAEYPLGTGPYYLEQGGAGLRLRRRSNWWCQAALPINASSIPLTVAESVSGIRDAFEFTDVGLVCADPGSDHYADYRCDYELWDSENGILLYLACNLDSAVFSNPQVRAALTHAIDRETIVSDFYRSFAHSASLPASPNSPYYNSQLAQKYAYDSAKFTQAVSESGATGTVIKLLVNKNDTLRLRIARGIREMLTTCGLTVEMLELTGEDYLYTLNTRAYDLYLGQTKLSANMDLSAFFGSGGALRYGGLSDAAMYAMCLEALANRGNYLTLHKMIMDDGRLCPILFQSYSIHATRGLLTGLTPSRDNVFYYSSGRTMEDALIVAE